MAYSTPEEAAANSPFAGSKPARTRAAQTPTAVRKAMLAGPREVCGLTLHPLSLDILWTLESVGHPLADPARSADQLAAITPLQTAQMVFAFAAPLSAVDAAAQPAEEGAKLSPYDKEAFAFLRKSGVSIAQLGELGSAIAQLIQEGLAPAPGDGNPPKGA
jgi:hypothetical protein